MNTITHTLLNMSVRKKLLGGFGLILVITLATAWIGNNSLNSTLKRIDNLLGVSEIDTTLLRARQHEKNYLLRDDENAMQQALTLSQQIQDQAAAKEAVLVRPENKALMRQIQEDASSYRNELLQLQAAGKVSSDAQQAMEISARAALKGFNDLADTLRQQAVEQIRMNGEQDSIGTLERANQANDMAMEMLQARRREKDFLLRHDPQYAQMLDEHFNLLDSKAQQLLAAMPSGDARSTVQEAIKELTTYRNNFGQLKASIGELKQSENDMTERAREVTDASTQSLKLQRELLVSDTDSAKRNLLLASVIAFILGGICSLFITQAIVGPLQRVVGIARQIANGDLTGNIDSDRRDELGQLMQAMQAMTLSLRDLISKLSSGITQLATAAEELSAVTEQTSAGVTEQRMETEQVATAMNQMTATVQDVARNAENAANSASEAEGQTGEGATIVQQAISHIEQLAQTVESSAETITRLKGDSANISTVLDVIKSIAEQTNLLALNAAIEAARAGEAGRGFAVVADEVRALARRTQESTQQIEQLVATLQNGAESAVNVMTQSRSMAGETVDVARHAGAALTRIDEAVSRIQQMNQQIATASEQQSSVAEEINRSISSIRDIAEQSAAATEETSAASIDLARLGGELQLQVNRFRIS
ncbi:Methyl-accepting chemotaxis protein [Pseudomonas sp. 8Z]|nr:methyl-accepting chemotaxis protein [Pseudomonas sp. 8Z]VXC73505.1 Methyl-accepting chemotaxis protein [Pseudomonas sp. 8Z]